MLCNCSCCCCQAEAVNPFNTVMLGEPANSPHIIHTYWLGLIPDHIIIVLLLLLQLDTQGFHNLLLKLYGKGSYEEGWPGPLPGHSDNDRAAFVAHAQAWWAVFFAVENYTSPRYPICPALLLQHFLNLIDQLPPWLALNPQSGLWSTRGSYRSSCCLATEPCRLGLNCCSASQRVPWLELPE